MKNLKTIPRIAVGSIVLIIAVIAIVAVVSKPMSSELPANSQKEVKEVAEQNLFINSTEFNTPINNDRGFSVGILSDLAAKDLEIVKSLREPPKENLEFEHETLMLAQDVMHAAGRVAYFPAKRALVECLKSDENITKIEELILNYDQANKYSEEAPALAHFGLIAVGERSREEGMARASNVYAGLARHLSNLVTEESQNNLRAARLTDVYDLTRNIIKNQISGPHAELTEVLEVFQEFNVKGNYLNHQMKEELKKAVASVSELKTIEQLDELNSKLDTWFSIK